MKVARFFPLLSVHTAAASLVLVGCGEEVARLKNHPSALNHSQGSPLTQFDLNGNPVARAEFFRVTGEGQVESPEKCSLSIGAGGNYREGSIFLSGKCQNQVFPPVILGSAGSRYVQFSTNGSLSTAGNDRVEFAGPMIPFDKTISVSFDFKLPSSNPVHHTMFYALQVWQCSPLSPIAGMRVLPGNVVDFMVRHQNNPSGTSLGQFRMNPDVWYSFAMAVKPNPSGNGRMEVWANGVKIVDRSVPFGSNIAGSCEGNAGVPNASARVKFGIYKGAEAAVFRTFFDNVFAGTSGFGSGSQPVSQPSAQPKKPEPKKPEPKKPEPKKPEPKKEDPKKSKKK
jgi:hypothetical protein